MPQTGRWINKDAKNIRWVAKLGSTTYGTPIVADGQVYCATNNGGGWVKKFPADHRSRLPPVLPPEATADSFGSFRAKSWPPAVRRIGPSRGFARRRLVEDGRAWIVTNRGEVVCVNAKMHVPGDSGRDAGIGTGGRDRLDLRHDQGTWRRAAQHDERFGHLGRRSALREHEQRRG